MPPLFRCLWLLTVNLMKYSELSLKLFVEVGCLSVSYVMFLVICASTVLDHSFSFCINTVVCL